MGGMPCSSRQDVALRWSRQVAHPLTEMFTMASGGSGLLSGTGLGAAASQPLHSAAPPGEKLRAVTLEACTCMGGVEETMRTRWHCDQQWWVEQQAAAAAAPPRLDWPAHGMLPAPPAGAEEP